MASIQTLSNNAVSINARGKSYALDPREGDAAVETASLVESSRPTRIRFQPVGSLDGRGGGSGLYSRDATESQVRVLFPDA